VRSFRSSSETRQSSIGVYASDQLAITKYLELVGSVRFDAFNTEFVSRDSAGVVTAPPLARDRLFNWRAGVVGHPVEKVSVYAMYGTSTNPSAELATLNNDTAELAPERNAIIEAGAKAELLDGRLNLAGAVFRIDKLNGRVNNPDPDPTAPPVLLSGQQRVEGINVGAQGTIFDRWQLLANYAYMTSEIRSNPVPFLVGQSLPNTPEHSLSMWTTLAVTSAFTLGGGVTYQSATVVNNPTETQTLNRVPAFWRWDALASYQLGLTELQLNLSNLSNALYYDQYYAGHAVPAEARSATLTARFRF
jgi:catecholate siderophore receptor